MIVSGNTFQNEGLSDIFNNLGKSLVETGKKLTKLF